MEYTRLLWQNIISTITKLGNNWVFSRRQTGELTSKSTCLYLSVTNHFCILWNNSVCKSRISNAERFYFVWSLIAVRIYLSKKIYCLNNWKWILNVSWKMESASARYFPLLLMDTKFRIANPPVHGNIPTSCSVDRAVWFIVSLTGKKF